MLRMKETLVFIIFILHRFHPPFPFPQSQIASQSSIRIITIKSIDQFIHLHPFISSISTLSPNFRVFSDQSKPQSVLDPIFLLKHKRIQS
ncbi:hypothetical protein QVD17_31910 [Tagetes erecta]|uniref:Uncharacterized protein n=1 Tax=Tagetes erecta TaxID=13708 RepID=A0AAD8K4N9_TARER|nr:hypothetical protein QVD17_31910 [Tagetes erecta]